MRPEDDSRVEVVRLHLTQELATAATRRQHVQAAAVVLPDSDNATDPVLPGRHHCCDSGMLGSAQKPVPDPVSMQTPR